VNENILRSFFSLSALAISLVSAVAAKPPQPKLKK
jgi:hypothetical protein